MMQNTVSVLSHLRARELGGEFYTQLDEVFWMGKREYEFSGTHVLTVDNVAFERQPSETERQVLTAGNPLEKSERFQE